jgi:thiamine-phosphate pyrophosphorylase
LSNGTEQRILCYVTDASALSAVPTDAESETEYAARLIERACLAAEAGVNWIQVRDKNLNARMLHVSTVGIRLVVKELGARVIVNDRLDVAVAAQAGGVHLGRESLPVKELVSWREKEKSSKPVLEDFLIGASCHSFEEARAAALDGADYLIFGPVFETPSKMKFGPPLGVERLREVCSDLRIPVLAIGGIDLVNAGKCFDAGAAGIAAIRLFQDAKSAEDLRERIEALRFS